MGVNSSLAMDRMDSGGGGSQGNPALPGRPVINRRDTLGSRRMWQVLEPQPSNCIHHYSIGFSFSFLSVCWGGGG